MKEVNKELLDMMQEVGLNTAADINEHLLKLVNEWGK